MALIACRECQKEISDQAVACPHCGAPASASVAEPVREKSGLWMWLLGTPAALLALVMVVGAFSDPGNDEKALGRDAIDMCWSEQERKSNTPGEARFIAGACEKMERDFRSKWGVNP